MWYRSNFFKYATAIILCLLIIYLFGKVEYFISPFKQFIATIFFPLILSGLVYYVLRPVVRWLEMKRVPKSLSIISVILAFAFLLVLAGIQSSSLIINQLIQLSNDIPKILDASMKLMADASSNRNLDFIPFESLQNQLFSYSNKMIDGLPDGILRLLSTLTNVATVLLLVPFILFYLLRDDHLFASYILKFVPSEHKSSAEEILEDIDRTLSAYINSMVIVALFIGLLTYIGYMMVGLNYAFILALFAAVTSIIPIVGNIIGILPAVLVGIPGGYLVILKILVIAAIVQTIQGNVISPLIMGKSLDIHPITYIIVFLAAASLYGFVGILIGVPLYAVLKVTIGNLVRIIRLRKTRES